MIIETLNYTHEDLIKSCRLINALPPSKCSWDEYFGDFVWYKPWKAVMIGYGP